MDVPAQSPAPSDTVTTLAGPVDLSTLTDEELEHQIRALQMEIEERDVRIRALEGYITRLDAHEAALEKRECRLASVLDCSAQGASCAERCGDREREERARKRTSRPRMGIAGH